jgi:predicted amidohydrolase
MYIIAGLPIWEQGKLYNAAYLYDRQGQRVGLYRKIHPTESEMEDGISPGCTPTAFDLDFGRVGVTICFDIGWPAEWQALAELHPDVVCWLSAYDGGFPLQCYAWTGRHYIVTSVWSTDARFIDITGNIISRTGQWTRLAIEDLNLDRELFHVQTNWLQLAEIQNRYGNAVRVRGYTEEGCFVLDLREESVTMKQLSAEFGLEPFDDFHGRIGKMQDQRRGEPIGSPMAMGSQARVQ